MKSQPSITWLIALFHLFGCLLAKQANAQQPTALGQEPQVGIESSPELGQGTNTIRMRQVGWTDSHGFEIRRYVLHVRESKETIVVASTNQLCYSKGKLYSIAPGIQSLSVQKSEAVDAIELTKQAAADFALEGRSLSKPPERVIDLKPLLESEAELHLAQPLLLRTVEVQSPREGSNTVVNFESYTGIKGKVVLDDEMRPLSMVLTGSPP